MPANIKRSVKFSLYVLGAVVVLLLVAPLFFDAEDFKPEIIEQAEQATGHRVEIGGISASLFPWVGIELEDVKILNREGFSDQPFFSVESLDVEMALFPLFNKRVEITRFVLEAPRLLLERNEQGFGNWEEPVDAGDATLGLPEKAPSQTSPDGETAEGTPVGPALAGFTAEAIRVNHGKIIWLDTKTGARAEISELQLDMDSVSLDSPIPVNVSGEIEDSGFTLNGQLGPVSDLAAFDVAKLPVQAHLKGERLAFGVLVDYVPALARYADLRLDADAQFEQRPDGLRLFAGKARLTAMHDLTIDWKMEMPTSGEVLLRSLDLAVDGKQIAQARGEIHGIGSDIKYEMRVNTPEVSRQTLALWLPQLDSMYADHPDPWRQFKLGMLVSGDMKHLDLRDLQLLLDGELLQSSGVVHFGSRPDLKLRLAANTLHITPWLPKPDPNAGIFTPVPGSTESNAAIVDSGRTKTGTLISPAQPRQGAVIQPGQKVEQDREGGDIVSAELVQGDASGTPEPDLRFLVPWRVAAQVQIDQLFLHGLEMKHVRANLSGKKGKFKLDPLTFKLAGGQVREQATINVARYPVRWTESSTIKGMRVEPVLAALTDKALLSGVADMELNLEGRGLLAASATHSLSGQGNVRIRDGRIKGFDIPGMLERLTVLGRETGSKVTEFSQLEGIFVIKNGIVNNDDLYMASPIFRLTGYGRIDLPRQLMDYHVRPRLLGIKSGEGDTAGVRKGMTIPIRLVGPLSNPKPKLEIKLKDLMESAEALPDVIKQIGKQIKEGNAEDIRKTLEELFPRREQPQ